jgi:hypothetical protein
MVLVGPFARSKKADGTRFKPQRESSGFYERKRKGPTLSRVVEPYPLNTAIPDPDVLLLNGEVARD